MNIVIVDCWPKIHKKEHFKSVFRYVNRKTSGIDSQLWMKYGSTIIQWSGVDSGLVKTHRRLFCRLGCWLIAERKKYEVSIMQLYLTVWDKRWNRNWSLLTHRKFLSHKSTVAIAKFLELRIELSIRFILRYFFLFLNLKICLNWKKFICYNLGEWPLFLWVEKNRNWSLSKITSIFYK